jgi:hypothetical protein
MDGKGGASKIIFGKCSKSADRIGTFKTLSARNAEKRPRKGKIPWLSMTSV